VLEGRVIGRDNVFLTVRNEQSGDLSIIPEAYTDNDENCKAL